MGLDKTMDEIIKNAKKDASLVKKEGYDEAVSILKTAKANASETEKCAVSRAEDLVESIEKKELSSVKLQCKRIELDAKKKIIDKVFVSVEEKVSKLDLTAKKRIYDDLLKRLTDEMDIGCIFVNPKDSAIIRSIAPKTIEIEESDISGGMIVENKSKNIRIDATFDNLLEQVREDSLKTVSQILFE